MNTQWTVTLKNEGSGFYVEQYTGSEEQVSRHARNAVRALRNLLPFGTWSAGIEGQPEKGRHVTMEVTVI